MAPGSDKKAKKAPVLGRKTKKRRPRTDEEESQEVIRSARRPRLRKTTRKNGELREGEKLRLEVLRLDKENRNLQKEVKRLEEENSLFKKLNDRFEPMEKELNKSLRQEIDTEVQENTRLRQLNKDAVDLLKDMQKIIHNLSGSTPQNT